VSAPLPIEVSAQAAAQVHAAETWWQAHRPKAPGAIRAELERASSLLAAQPHIGTHARNIRLPNVRRLHLGRIHYDLYYRVSESPPRLEVLAFWHASREGQPPI
jgi:plasmid stabilization system protein ParE